MCDVSEGVCDVFVLSCVVCVYAWCRLVPRPLLFLPSVRYMGSEDRQKLKTSLCSLEWGRPGNEAMHGVCVCVCVCDHVHVCVCKCGKSLVKEALQELLRACCFPQ